MAPIRLIILPLVRGYYQRFATEGIVYFLRMLYLLFSLGIAAGAYAGLVSISKRTHALSAALVAVAFIPLNIPALSYNTLGGGLFALALFLGFAFARDGGRLKWVAANAALALSEFAYPPIFLAGICFIALSFQRQARDRRFILIASLSTHLAVALLFLPHLWRLGSSLIPSLVYSWTAQHHGGGLTKFIYVLSFLLRNVLSAEVLLSFALIALSFGLRNRRPLTAAIALTAFPVLLFAGYRNWAYPSTWFFTYFAMAGPILYSFGRRGEARRLLLFAVWLPSALAGLITAWVSAGSPANIIIGFWGGGIVSALFFIEAVEHLTRTSPQRLRTFLSSAAPAIVLGGLVLFLFVGQVFYCDGEFFRLTETIPQGPFRGLHTTVEKRKYLAEISDDIRALENPLGRIVFYEFPAGYLLTKMRPGVNSAWMRTVSLGKRFYANYYRDQLGPHDLVFAIHLIDHGYPSPIHYPAEDPFIRFVQGSHRLVLDRGRYQVFTPVVPLLQKNL